MKTSRLMSVIACALTLSGAAPAQEPPTAPTGRIGVYDSRVVAYADFWNPATGAERDRRVKAARAAKAAGDTTTYATLSRALKSEQQQIHLSVFSTAPAQHAMAALHDRLPALQRELKVDAFVSKWDKAALRRVPEANRVDVTDRLVAEFLVATPRQKEIIDKMRTTQPLPLWKAKMIAAFGGL